jgi:hypothetical protein
VKEPGKTITIVEVDITSALSIPLSSDFPKMWVRIRLKRRGFYGPFYKQQMSEAPGAHWEHYYTDFFVSRYIK